MILTKIRLHAKYLNEPKYEFWIKKREDVGKEYCTYPNSFIECSNTMHDVYENIDEYNPKDVRLNSAQYFVMKINNRKEFQNITINHSQILIFTIL